MTTLVMSFLLLYLKVFAQEKLRKYIHVTMVLTLANWAFLQFSNIFYSRSLSKVWDWAHKRPVHCWNVNQLLLAGGGMTVIMDIVIIVLPIREIMRSRFSPKKRLEITPIFVVDIM
ncbi:hypothetical protein HBH64_152550 [Parastagonospora nodorum]|nr:hypothetical protein HBI01_027910 [Parastagonospora nodorum]KAH4338448.1 hypothetical protein HBI00_004800 [Parastagonospora nodorum]KAH4523183.1 hypothetical protein HBH87_064190 [Parastagonospora nodorum]KAH4598311.1 hypothetical protein HBH83_006590 [Parastagonospora nodorum]KAH4679274.1 hypothetical protein HBH80_044890 [Parastagonospora nodorum]